MENNTSIDCRDFDRRTPNRTELHHIALTLLDNANDIENLFPFQANGLRNMAKVIDPTIEINQ